MARNDVAQGEGLGTLSDKRTRTVHRILTAAMEAMTREGMAGLTMSTLAQQAGVSRQTLYNYFPDIDAVVAGLVRLGDEGTAALASQLEAEPDAEAALRTFVEAVVASAAAGHPSPLALAAALPAPQREVMVAHEAQAERLVIDIVRRGQAEGAFRAELDPELDGRILYRSAMSASELVGDPGVDSSIVARHLSIDLLNMVAVDSSTSRVP